MKHQYIVIGLFMVAATLPLFAQQPAMPIFEKKLKLEQDYTEYFALLQGDQLIIDFSLEKANHVTAFELRDYYGNTLFYQFKVGEINNKVIQIPKNSVYCISIKKGGISRKLANLRLHRVPSSAATNSFDVTVKEALVIDSTYINRYVPILTQVDTNIVSILERTERVHAFTKLNDQNTTAINFSLPKNSQYNLESKELVAWAYWIGVGNEGAEAYIEEQKQFLSSSAAQIGGLIHPLAGLALGAYAMVYNPPKGDNVKFSISTVCDNETHEIIFGDSTVASARVDKYQQGDFVLTLRNDNFINGINVDVKIMAVLVTKKYKSVSFLEHSLIQN